MPIFQDRLDLFKKAMKVTENVEDEEQKVNQQKTILINFGLLLPLRKDFPKFYEENSILWRYLEGTTLETILAKATIKICNGSQLGLNRLLHVLKSDLQEMLENAQLPIWINITTDLKGTIETIIEGVIEILNHLLEIGKSINLKTDLEDPLINLISNHIMSNNKFDWYTKLNGTTFYQEVIKNVFVIFLSDWGIQIHHTTISEEELKEKFSQIIQTLLYNSVLGGFSYTLARIISKKIDLEKILEDEEQIWFQPHAINDKIKNKLLKTECSSKCIQIKNENECKQPDCVWYPGILKNTCQPNIDTDIGLSECKYKQSKPIDIDRLIGDLGSLDTNSILLQAFNGCFLAQLLLNSEYNQKGNENILNDVLTKYGFSINTKNTFTLSRTLDSRGSVRGGLVQLLNSGYIPFIKEQIYRSLYVWGIDISSYLDKTYFDTYMVYRTITLDGSIELSCVEDSLKLENGKLSLIGSTYQQEGAKEVIRYYEVSMISSYKLSHIKKTDDLTTISDENILTNILPDKILEEIIARINLLGNVSNMELPEIIYPSLFIDDVEYLILLEKESGSEIKNFKLVKKEDVDNTQIDFNQGGGSSFLASAKRAVTSIGKTTGSAALVLTATAPLALATIPLGIRYASNKILRKRFSPPQNSKNKYKDYEFTLTPNNGETYIIPEYSLLGSLKYLKLNQEQIQELKEQKLKVQDGGSKNYTKKKKNYRIKKSNSKKKKPNVKNITKFKSKVNKKDKNDSTKKVNKLKKK